jgi:Tol biopolymer transport system component
MNLTSLLLALVFLSSWSTLFAASTALISGRSQKNQSNGASTAPAVSENGQFVAFASFANNLDRDRCRNGFSHIFLRDRTAGTITCISLSSGGEQGNQNSQAPTLSADGGFIAFESMATNLAGENCESAFSQIFVHDLTAGTMSCVSVDAGGRRGNQHSHAPSISADGQVIAFDSRADNLDGACDNGFSQIFVHNRATATTRCISVSADGNLRNGDSFDPSITADGRVVVFHSAATNLPGQCGNGNSHIFMHGLPTGQTTCVSVNSDGNQSNGNSGLARISGDGGFVAFESDATNLTARCNNGFVHVFVRELGPARTACVSIDNRGEQANNDSTAAAISFNGRLVAFSSTATNLTVNRCTEGNSQVFVRDRADGSTACASVGRKRVSGNSNSANPALSGDGLLVSFESDATNLVKKDTNGNRDIFAHIFSVSEDPPLVTIEFGDARQSDIGLAPGLSLR